MLGKMWTDARGGVVGVVGVRCDDVEGVWRGEQPEISIGAREGLTLGKDDKARARSRVEIGRSSR